MKTQKNLHNENWEQFDAEALFPPPALHANHLTKVDKKEMTKVDALDENPEMSGNSNPEELGDIYSNSPLDKNHVDEMFEMEGSADSNSADDREVKADKEMDKRTEKSEQSDEQEAEDSSTGDEQIPEEKNVQPSGSDEKETELTEKEGAENPIQKESEGVEEVAEATNKTSEDVHGGDEATKDIEDSPNAADDGQNPENKGAESGESGEDGEGNGEGVESESGNAKGESCQDGNGEGGDSSEPTDEEGKGKFSGNPLSIGDAEEWEAKSDHSANALKLINDLDEVEAKARNEKGHRTGLPQYNFNREASPVELEIAFRKASELLKKFAAEEEITARRDGSVRWDAEKLVRSMIIYRHQQIPSNKYEHPKEADICILLDISGSCAQQAEMFMAIAAGSIGSGVRVFVGYNGSCRACAMDQPKRRIRSYVQAKPWVQSEVERVSGWNNQATIGEWGFEQFLEEAQPKTVIIFGDWDGVDQYTYAVGKPKFKKIKFFWFANEGEGRRRKVNSQNSFPKGFTKKNYIPGIFTPRDFVKALRVLK